MLKHMKRHRAGQRHVLEEKRPVTKKDSRTKKDIVRDIADLVDLPQLKTKEVVQETFNAILKTLLELGRIELRNFGVFEVKQRRSRKARNPRTGDPVEVPPKNVVTFKPGKKMEEKVRNLKVIPRPPKAADGHAGNGQDGGKPRLRLKKSP